jgi:hypothetical protein
MNQGTQGYNLTKKTEGRKSRDTVPLRWPIFKQKKGSATINLGLNYCSMGSSHSLSRDTVPLRYLKKFYLKLF